MTWLKLSDDFALDCARAKLSDTAVRVHVEGLLWAMHRETDGFLDGYDISRGIEARGAQTAVEELVAAGFWEELAPNEWRILHHMEHQPESDVLAARRKSDAERQRRKRRRALAT